MLKIIDRQINITRGDSASIVFGAKDENGDNYTFAVGDVLRFKVFKKKDVASVVLTKDVVVEEETTEVTISLTNEDTTIGDLINKPTTYWYEVSLNPDTIEQTIIGYDIEGTTEFVLYPEGNEI